MGEPRDSDDFLGWAPDVGFWDAPTEPPAMTRTPQAPAAPTPAAPRRTPTPAPHKGATALPGTVVRPPAPSPTRPQSTGRQGQPPNVRVPLSAAFLIMLLATMWNALLMTGDGTGASPVALAVCGAVTALLGTLIWGRGRR
ncbi:MAG TPA: hypothetical protein VGK53_00375 [Propionicimonas sp.]